jgi:hypothetical protein
MLIALLSAVLVLPAAAKTIYVNETGWWIEGGAFNASSCPVDAAIDDDSNEALPYSLEDGDTIFVYNGTYLCCYTDNDPVSIRKSITLKGEGADVVTFDLQGYNIYGVPTGDRNYIGVGSSAIGAIVDGIKIVNSSKGIVVNSPDCIVRNCVIDGLTNYMSIATADNITFENNVVSNAYRPGLDFFDLPMNGSKLINNTFINNTGCIGVWTANPQSGGIITRNNFINNDVSGAAALLWFWNAGDGDKIYLNNFVGTVGENVKYDGIVPVTYWNSTEPIEYTYGGTTYTSYLGNYWGSNYTGVDMSPEDGIGDTAYDIPPSSPVNSDYRPLMAPFEEYFGEPLPPAEEIYNGTVLLFNDTFTWYDSYSGVPHTVNWLTPHGALETASADAGFAYGGSWKGSKNTALIDWIGNYTYNTTLAWNYQLNGVYQNYFSDVTGVSNNPVGDGDFIEFYFGPKYDETTDNAIAFVRLTVEEANASVYFEPEDVRVPGYCNTTTVGVWVNPVVAMGSGKLTFNYTYCCLNVTDFDFDTTNFDPGVSGTLTTAILTPGQVVLNFATGAQEGVGPGPVHIGDATFHCCRESGEYCETILEWVPGYPDSYVEDTGAHEITPVLYTDGIFRCNIPDLVITSIVGTGNDTHYTVTYTIKNIGAASAPAGHSTCLSIDGSLVETKVVPDALAAGEERTYSFDSVIARNTSKPYDPIQVCADCEDEVIELDEANNCLDGRYPAEVVVTVIPELTLVQPQDQFDVKIHIDTKGQEILGVQYVLTYDTSVLRAETQTKGPFLGSIGDTIVVVNTIDQAHGVIEYAETRKGDTGVTGEGNVSTIHFIAIGERGDSSPLVLSEVIVVDVNKEETLVKLEDGQVNITENQPPIAIGSSKFLINNVAKKYPSTAILCSCSYDLDWPGKGGNITYIRWAFGDGQYGTSEGLPVENCTCKEHNYESWLWEDGAYLPFDVLLTVTDDGCPEATNSTNFSVSVYIAGDANGDGEVNILDAVWVGKHWREMCTGSYSQPSAWPELCDDCTKPLWSYGWSDEHVEQRDGADLNNDCEINILDAVVIGANWRHVAWE